MIEKCAPIYAKLEEKFGPQVTRNFNSPDELALFLYSIGSDFMIALGRDKMLFENCITQLRRAAK